MGIARTYLLVFLLSLSPNAFKISVLAEAATTEFTFRGFKGNQTEIQTEGAAEIRNSDGLLRLTNRDQNVTGTAFYGKPIRLRDRSHNNSSAIKICSFSTSFVFVIIPSSPGNGGFGFTFTLSPTPNRPGAESAQYMGLLNRSNNGNQSNHVFAVEFDTVQGFKDGADRRGNHIGLDFNNLFSDVQEPLSYHDTDYRKEDFDLESGESIRA
uniref:Putative L-type lectin-domain containing receptor kinase VI.1 n=1 Tax=Noccaea caerulescens TaxID=107243 RepID=A0A1J3D8S9_NOCCA